MRAGRLRHQLALDKLAGTVDSLGQPDQDWQLVDTVMAEIVHLSGTGGERNGAQTSALQALIRIYARTDVAAGMRGRANGLVYEIKAALPYGDRGVYQQLTCEVLR